MEPETQPTNISLLGVIKKIFKLIFYAFAILIVCIVALVWLTDDTETSTQQSESCLRVPEEVVSRIESGLTVTGGGTLQNPRAVKSSDFGSVFFISADLQGAGLEGNTDIATFATNRLDATGMTFSVGSVATEFSDWPKGSETAFNITSGSHGVSESKRCVSDL